MRNILSFVNFLLIAFSLSFGVASTVAHGKMYKIASGSILEPNYFIGLKLCEYIQKYNSENHCQVIPTSGSMESLHMLQKGEADFAFSQADIALREYNKALEVIENDSSGLAEDRRFHNLRQIIKLHDEVLTMLAKDDDHILVFADIEGKKISNGPSDSDRQDTYNRLEKLYSFDIKPIDIEIPHENYARALCSGEVSSILMITSHPNALVSHVASSCDTEFISLDQDKIDEFISKNPVFRKVTLNATAYPDIEEDQESIGVSSMLVALKDVDSQLVKSFVNDIKENPKDFKSAHPVLKHLQDDYFEKEFDLPGIFP